MQKIILFFFGILIVQNFFLRCAESGKSTYSFPAMVGALAFVGKNILASDKDKGVCLKNFQGGILREYSHGDMRPARNLVVSHDEALMASSINDVITISDTQTGQCLQKIKETAERYDLHRICMSHDKNIITANNHKELCAVDMRSGDIIASYSPERGQQFFADHALSPSGNEVIFIEYHRGNNLVCAWDLKASPRLRIHQRDFGIWHMHEPMVLSLDYSPDGKQVLVGNWGNPHTIDVLDSVDDYRKAKMFTLVDNSQGGRSTYVRYNYDGDRFVAAVNPNNLFVMDPQAGDVKYSLKAEGEILNHFMIPCFGKDLLAAISESGIVHIWDLAKKSDN